MLYCRVITYMYIYMYIYICVCVCVCIIPGGGHGHPLQYFCLENPMGRGAWRATVHRVAKSQMWLKRLSSSSPTLCDPMDCRILPGACEAPLPMGFSRQKNWIGLPCPPPAVLPNPGIQSKSLMSLALAGKFLTTSATWKALITSCTFLNWELYKDFRVEEPFKWHKLHPQGFLRRKVCEESLLIILPWDSLSKNRKA